MEKKKSVLVWLLITVAVTLFAFFLNWAAETSCGKVVVKSGVVLNEFGDTNKYKAYIPKTASAENPAPVLLYLHGGSDGTSVQTAYCIEMSRRGFVVVTWDASGAVESELSASVDSGALAIFNMVNDWNFVDKKHMITGGHSAGANGAMAIAQNHPDQVLLQINIGYDMYGNPELGYPFNFVFILSNHDDSCMARTTNSGTISEVHQAKKLKAIFNIPETETLVVDKEYGNWANKTGRELITENCAHMYYPIDGKTQSDFISIITKVYSTVGTVPNNIPAEKHTYIWEHIASILLYLSLASYIFIIASQLFKFNFFKKLELPELPAVGFEKKSWQWWVVLVWLFILPVLTFRLMVTTGLYTKFTWFITLKSKEYGLWMGWSILTAAFYLATFLVYHFTWGKKHGGNIRTYGFATTETGNGFCWAYFLKSILYAFVVMFAAYVIMLFMKAVTNNNIHIIAFCISPIEKHRWFVFLFFFIFQIPYYLFGGLAARSINMNNGSRNNVKGLVGSVALGGVMGAFGLVLLRIFLMICLYNLNRNVLFVDLYWLLGSNGITTVFLTFLVSNALNCYVTNRTNSVYAGVASAMLWSTWLMVACQRIVAYHF